MSGRIPEVTNDRRTVDEIATTGASLSGAVAGAPRLAFGPFVADPETGQLLQGAHVVPLAPRPFETLLYLALRPHRVVSKAELMERLWPSTFVTDDVLVQCVVDIRRALGDPARTPHYVETIPRRGYRFMADVQPLPPDAPPDGADAGDNGHDDALPLAAPGDPVPARLVSPVAGPPPDRPGPRRTSRRLALAAAAVALLVAGAAIARWSLRPAAEPRMAEVEPGSVAIMPVSVEEPEPLNDWLRDGLAEMIRSQLGQTPGLVVLARHRVAAALADAGLEERQAPTARMAATAARRLRAQRLITGSFVRVENRFVLSAELVDAASGRVEGSASVRGVMPADLLDAVDELCLKLHQQLRASDSPAARWRPTRLTTRSVDASRLYMEALSLFALGGRAGAEQAEARLDQALVLDPRFAQAYVKKAEIQQWRRTWGYGNPDPAPAVRAAMRLVGDLPDRERLLVESFAALIVRNDAGDALRQWNSLLQFYPTYGQEAGIPGLVANTFLAQGRWDDVIMVGEAHADSPSLPDAERARLCSLLAQAFRQKGEFARGLQYARRAVTLWPTREGPRFLSQRATLARIALEAGRRDEALAELAAVRDAPDADVTNLTDAAWGFYMASRPGDAAAVVERALALDPGYGNAYHLRGWLQLARGEPAAAAESLETAFARTPRLFGSAHKGMVHGDLAALYYAGVAHQQAGHAERARAAFRALMAHCHELQQARRDEGIAADWQVGNYLARAAARLGERVPDPPRLEGDDTTYYVQSARLHAVQGQRELAIEEITRGLALGHGELPHLSDDPDFLSLHDHPEFRRLVTDRLNPGPSTAAE